MKHRMHAMFHFDRWRALGDPNDYVAWRAILHGPPTAPFADRTHTDATKEEMRESHTGLKDSDVARMNKRLAALGKPKSAEHLASLREMYVRMSNSPTWKQRLGERQKAAFA